MPEEDKMFHHHTKKTRKELNDFQDELMELINNKDDITYSDLLGLVSVVSEKIYQAGYMERCYPSND